MKNLRVAKWLSLIILFIGCTAHKNSTPTERKDMLQTIYVDTVAPETNVVKGGDLKVKIEGNLPNPAYTFDRFDVEVKGDVIEITPLAKHESGKIVTQALVPFEHVCEVKNLKPGTYEIKVVSRGEPVVSKEKVWVTE